MNKNIHIMLDFYAKILFSKHKWFHANNRSIIVTVWLKSRNKTRYALSAFGRLSFKWQINFPKIFGQVSLHVNLNLTNSDCAKLKIKFHKNADFWKAPSSRDYNLIYKTNNIHKCIGKIKYDEMILMNDLMR